MGRGVRRSALFLPGSQFPYRLEGGNLEVGGGDSSVLLVRGLSCSFLLGLRSGGGAGSGERKQDLPNSDAPNHGSISDLARGQRALMIPPSPGPRTGP